VALFNASSSFSVNRPRAVFTFDLQGLLADFAVGYTLSTSSARIFAVVGLVLGGMIFCPMALLVRSASAGATGHTYYAA